MWGWGIDGPVYPNPNWSYFDGVFEDSVSIIRGGTAGDWFYDTGFIPHGSGTQQLNALATPYGDLKASAQVEYDLSSDFIISPGSGAQVSIQSTDKIKYLFKPTLVKPLPEPLLLHLSVEAKFEKYFKNGFPGDTSDVSAYFSAGGPHAYYLLHGERRSDWMTGGGGNQIPFFPEGIFKDATTLYVEPQYVLPVDNRSPFQVAYDFTMGLTVTAGSLAFDASADASHTFRFDSITFPDGSTPESQGYALEFESGHISPNLRSVPEPSSAFIAGLAAVGVLGSCLRRMRSAASH